MALTGLKNLSLPLLKNADLLMNLFNHVHAVGVDVALRDVDDLDGVGQAGLFADAPIGKKIPKSFSFFHQLV